MIFRTDVNERLQVFEIFGLQIKPPLWSSGRSSWLEIERPVFDSRRYEFFLVVGLERGPLSLMRIIEELLDRNSSSFGLENRDYGCRNPLR
jgi:hypothetical protein